MHFIKIPLLFILILGEVLFLSTQMSYHLEKTRETICSLWSFWWEGSSKKFDEVDGKVVVVSIAALLVLILLYLRTLGKGTVPWRAGPRGLPAVGYLRFWAATVIVRSQS